MQELLEQGAHIIFLSLPRIIWCGSCPLTPSHAKGGVVVVLRDVAQPWLQTPPQTIHHPSPPCHEKALSSTSRWSLPWQGRGTGSQLLIIRRFRSYLMIVQGDWQGGVEWSVSGCIRIWQQVNLQCLSVCHSNHPGNHFFQFQAYDNVPTLFDGIIF